VKASTRTIEFRKTALALAIMVACCQGSLVYASSTSNDASSGQADTTESYSGGEEFDEDGGEFDEDGGEFGEYDPQSEDANADNVPINVEYNNKTITVYPTDWTAEDDDDDNLIVADGGALYRPHLVESEDQTRIYKEHVGTYTVDDRDGTPIPDYFPEANVNPDSPIVEIIDEEISENEDETDAKDESDGGHDKDTLVSEETSGSGDKNASDSEGIKDVLIEADSDGNTAKVSVGEIEDVYYVPESEPSEQVLLHTSNGTKLLKATMPTLIIGHPGSTKEHANQSRHRVARSAVDLTMGEGPVAQIYRGGTFEYDNGTLQAGEGYAGITLHGDGEVALHNTTLVATTGASFQSLIDQKDIQKIVVTGKSKIEDNNGVLLNVSRIGEGMNGGVKLTLSGNVSAKGNILDADAMDANGQRVAEGGIELLLLDGARWEGSHRGLQSIFAGRNATMIENEGAPITGFVTGQDGASLTFNAGASIGGSVTLLSAAEAKFLGDTTIGGDLFAADAAVRFSEAAIIGSSLVGENSRFEFNPARHANIKGEVKLINGSKLVGGSRDEPIIMDAHVYVSSNSVLASTLRAAGALYAGGGIVSPGDTSIGTQVFGSIEKMASGYIANINADGRSDLIVAKTGDIDVAGTKLAVSQENGNGGYRLNHDYTILKAETGKIVGEFASAGLDETFDGTLVHLQPVAYNTQDVQIRLAVDDKKVADKTKDLNPNSGSVLRALSLAAGGNAAADAALLSRNVQIALNQLSGELHAGTQSALLYSGNQVRQVISEHAGVNRAAPGTAAQAKPGAVWAQVTGGQFSLKGDGHTAKTRSHDGGLMVGGDGMVGANWRLGAALGYSDSAIKLENRGASKADVNSYTAALYGANRIDSANGQFDLLAGAAYTHHNIDTHRRIMIGGDQTLKSSYDAKSTQLFAEAGYGAKVGSDTLIGPFVALAWTNLKSDAFKENGGVAALRGQSSRDHTLTTTLGLRGKTHFDIGSAHAFLSGGLGWRHTNGNTDPARSMAFVNGIGTSFSIKGASIAKDAATLNLEVGAEVGKNTTIGLNYNGQLAKGMRDNHGGIFLKAGF
jgi:outer membrane autotransporter protein